MRRIDEQTDIVYKTVTRTFRIQISEKFRYYFLTVTKLFVPCSVRNYVLCKLIKLQTRLTNLDRKMSV